MYSNSGYFLLSQVVKRITGRSLRQFAAENIFSPLGMKTAEFRDDHKRPIPNRAEGYSRGGGTYRLNNPNFDVVGAGGVFMTVRDFARWDENFYAPKVGGREFVTQLQVPGRTSDGAELTYAFGLSAGKYRGLDIVEHGGSYGGFRAHVIRFPGQHFSVVCFTNLASMEPSRLSREVANLYLVDAFTAPATAERTVTAQTSAKKTGERPTPKRAALERYIGTYRSEELGATFRIAAETTGALSLHAGRGRTIPLVALPDRSVTAGSWRLDFRDGGAAFTVNSARAQGVLFRRE